jgi:hypothetical protein
MDFEIRQKALKNMQSYTEAEVPPREDIVKLMFEIMEIAFGVKWNKKGSFTPSSAQNVIRLAVSSIFHGKGFVYRMVVKGLLADLEMGVTDFRSFAKLLTDPAIRGFIEGKLDDAGRLDLLVSLKTLRGEHGFPTSPPERRYVGKAVQDVSPQMAVGIDNMLRSKGLRLK